MFQTLLTLDIKIRILLFICLYVFWNELILLLCLQDEDGNIVLDEDGKPRIHTDGTGFISEDLALRCPRNCYHGSFPDDPNFEVYA